MPASRPYKLCCVQCHPEQGSAATSFICTHTRQCPAIAWGCRCSWLRRCAMRHARQRNSRPSRVHTTVPPVVHPRKGAPSRAPHQPNPAHRDRVLTSVATCLPCYRFHPNPPGISWCRHCSLQLSWYCPANGRLALHRRFQEQDFGACSHYSTVRVTRRSRARAQSRAWILTCGKPSCQCGTCGPRREGRAR